MASETSYRIWEPEVPQIIPERSRLYSLNPIGIGTPQVESLTGYIARLAEAHVLSVGDLVGRDPLCIARAGPSQGPRLSRSGAYDQWNLSERAEMGAHL